MQWIIILTVGTERARSISRWMFESDGPNLSKEQLIDRARAQLTLRMHKEALDSFESVLSTDPGDPFAWLGKGIVALQLDRIGDAVDAFEKGRTLDPRDLQLQVHLGYGLLLQGNSDRALDLLDEAFARAPDEVVCLLYKGKVVGDGRQNWTEALQYFERALTVDPDSYEALTHVVAALALLGRYEEALAACDVALGRQPNCPVSLSNKAGILSALGNSSQALATIERAIIFDRSLEDAWLTKGTILAGNYCDFPRAMTTFDTARRLAKPGVKIRIVDAWARAADTLLRRSRPRTAIWCLDCGIRYCPEAPSLLTKKGVILYQNLRRRRAGTRALLTAKERGDGSADRWIQSLQVRTK
jgi:tetratricopeptide (TPR) repeat protein